MFAGAFFMPWRGLPNISGANAEFVYMPLFDLGTPVIRTSVPLSKVENPDRISHEIRLGFVLDGPNVWPIAAERFSRCGAALSDDAGLTISIGGTCVDEPTAGVDVGGRAAIVDLMAEISASSSIAAILVTHNLQAIDRCAERVLYLEQSVKAWGLWKELAGASDLHAIQIAAGDHRSVERDGD